MSACLQQEGVSLNEIAVVARTNRLCRDFEPVLNQDGINTYTSCERPVYP